jgi:hypothetical protein
MVKASGWPSYDRQFEPYPRAIMAAPLWCGLDAVQTLVVENINKWDFLYFEGMNECMKKHGKS